VVARARSLAAYPFRNHLKPPLLRERVGVRGKSLKKQHTFDGIYTTIDSIPLNRVHKWAPFSPGRRN